MSTRSNQYNYGCSNCVGWARWRSVIMRYPFTPAVLPASQIAASLLPPSNLWRMLERAETIKRNSTKWAKFNSWSHWHKFSVELFQIYSCPIANFLAISFKTKILFWIIGMRWKCSFYNAINNLTYCYSLQCQYEVTKIKSLQIYTKANEDRVGC